VTEPTTTIDAEKYKRSQHDQWNEDAPAWHRWGPTLHRWFGPVAEVMLDLAEVRPGQRVLDIATGAGEPALSAAARVGPEGYVLATDLSENILEFARQNAAKRNLENLETRPMDGENLDLPDSAFDVVLCRFGIIYMPNRLQALREWRRVLRPGGRAVIAVYSTSDRNGWGAVPVSIIRQRAQLSPPLPGQPGPFSLGGAGVLETALREAGFQDIVVRPISAPVRMASAQEFIHFASDAFGAFNQMMAHLSRDERDRIWAEAATAMKAFEGPQGFEAPCEPLIGLGVK
jgi:SAM-dependent methyltransferase